MKLPVLAAILFFYSSQVLSQSGDTGVGISLGNPTGLTAKYRTGETTAIDASIGFDFGYLDNFYLSADYLIHRWTFEAGQNLLKIYFGPGGGLGFTSEISLSVRAPGGIGYYLNSLPLEAYAEFVPTFQIAGPGGVHFWIGGCLGTRWYF